MRIVVVEPPPPRLDGGLTREAQLRSASSSAPHAPGAARPTHPPLAVGAFDWRDPEPVATVVVKLTYDLAGDAPVLAAEQRPPATGNIANLEADLYGEVYYPFDFAPHKPLADVLVVGHACAPGGAAEQIPIGISVGSLTRAALARAAAPAEKIPLGGSCLLTPDGEHPDRVGPARIPADKSARALASDHVYSVFNAAPPEQRRAYLEPGETVRLSGLSPRGERVFELPRERPRVRAKLRGPLPEVELQMVADTLWIDVDRELMVIVWRGMLALHRPGLLDRLSVSLEPAGTVRPWPEILRSAGRGAFSISADPEDAERAPRDAEERDSIASARSDLILGPMAPEPQLTLAAYTALAAELAEQREPRADVLRRHDLDEPGWALEERAWLEGMANQAMAGDGTLAVEYGDAFVAAQDGLAQPHEASRTHADWAEITAALEVSADLPKELTRRGLRLSEWMRLDRRVQRAASADDEVARETDALLEEARARVAAAQGPEPDEEPDTLRPALLAGLPEGAGGDA
jgi:hypothetical protein